MIREHDFEPIRGLPERLPRGEVILWQGAPAWRSLARRVFHVRMIAVYGAALIGWRLVSGLYDGETLGAIAASASLLATLMLVAIGLFCGLAWLIERTTVYTVTNRRVVMRFGMALPMTVNFPFKAVTGADFKDFEDGHGNIALTLDRDTKIAYPILWPHVRPFRLARPEPTLRCVPDAGALAALMARAMAGRGLPRTESDPARRGAVADLVAAE